MKYKAIRFTLDGDYITDHYADTIQGVWSDVEAAGSRWVLYPICLVVKDDPHSLLADHYVVDAPRDFTHLLGKTVKTIQHHLLENSTHYQALLYGQA